MKAQRLKSMKDFLKRIEIIPQALLIISEDNYKLCDAAILELRALNFDLPFYELNLSESPELRVELSKQYGFEIVPTLIYFRRNKMISKLVGMSNEHDFSHFLTSAIHSDS